jgi:hypothetical protein
VAVLFAAHGLPVPQRVGEIGILDGDRVVAAQAPDGEGGREEPDAGGGGDVHPLGREALGVEGRHDEPVHVDVVDEEIQVATAASLRASRLSERESSAPNGTKKWQKMRTMPIQASPGLKARDVEGDLLGQAPRSRWSIIWEKAMFGPEAA